MFVYLVHFLLKLHHAQHYVGWTPLDWELRILHHRMNRGAHILQACNQRGIPYVVARVWPGGDRKLERWIKDQHGAARFCPICQGLMAFPEPEPIWGYYPDQPYISVQELPIYIGDSIAVPNHDIVIAQGRFV